MADRVQCTARSKRHQRRCRRFCAPGYHVCYYHGQGAGEPPTHGRYSKSLPKDLAERYEHFKSDPDILSLIPEIALLRTHLERFMHTYTERQPVSAEIGEEMRAWGETLSRVCERANKILYGEQYTLTVQGFNALLAQVCAVINEEIPDAVLRERIAERLRQIGQGK